MADRSEQAKSIFLKALEKHAPPAWPAFLDQACAGDAALRADVEKLLGAHVELGSFHEEARPPSGTTDTEAELTGALDMPLDFLAPPQRPDSLGRLGHYEILEVIGRGGMGIVLRAFDEKLHRIVAIKVMAPELAATSSPRKRFLREARSAAQVRHEHVVDIHAVEETPIPYLVMEYVAGETLQQKHERVGPFEIPEVLRVGKQIALGLAAAHERGLIHRDIKPSNILLEKGAEERVKITDFGLARAVADASLTQSGVIAGTPMYMAPEQTAGDSIDHRADLFSLGSVLYTMASGRPPFRATTSMATLKRVAEDTPRAIREIIPEVPEWLCDVIARLHAKKPDERIQSAKEVAELLSQSLAHVQQPLVASSPLPPSRKASGEQRLSYARSHRRLAIGTAVLVVLVGAISMTEAMGITNLYAKAIRILIPDGTLVVEADDPTVMVTVKGDGGLVISSTGLEEIRLRPGSYRVQADRDGKPLPLDKDLVEVARGERTIVKVKMEAAPALPAAKAEKGAFVLLSADKERAFPTLANAVQNAGTGDTIEIRGNGPFFIPMLRISGKDITLRAGPGCTPLLELQPGDTEANALIQVDQHRLTIEGVAFRRINDAGWKKGPVPALVLAVEAPLRLANCRFFVAPHNAVAIRADLSPYCDIRNCALIGTSKWLISWSPAEQTQAIFTLKNSVLRSESGGLVMWHKFGQQARISIKNNTFSLGEPITYSLGFLPLEPSASFEIECDANVFDCKRVMLQFDLEKTYVASQAKLTSDQATEMLPRLLSWAGNMNLYHVRKRSFLAYSQQGANVQPLANISNLKTWDRFWGSKREVGSAEPELLYQEIDPLKRNALDEKLDLSVMQLHPDIDRAIGAKLDAVGPGMAHEQWQMTDEFKKWSKHVAQ